MMNKLLIIFAVLALFGCSKSDSPAPTEAAGFAAPTQAEKDAALRNAQRMQDSLNRGY